MIEGTLLLVLAYVALTALLVTALVTTRLPLPVKAVVAIGAVALYVASYRGWQAIQGWPAATARLPERFLLHASVIEEPDAESGAAGAIFVWASDLAGGGPADSPRAYRLAYGKELHADLDEALRNMRNGTLQLGRVSRVAGTPDRPRDLTGFGEQRETLEFYTLPDPALPEK